MSSEALFEWQKIGRTWLLAAEDGRVIGKVVLPSKNAEACPIYAFLDGKGGMVLIGEYVSEATGKKAVETALTDETTKRLAHGSGIPIDYGLNHR